MDDRIKTLVVNLHNSPVMAVITITGAGSWAIPWLQAVPGASRSLIEARLPYSEAALKRFIGHRPDRFVSGDTALEMAKLCYGQALSLRSCDIPVVGIGCTAAISTNRARAGDHRVHVASWDRNGSTEYKIKFTKGYRDRFQENIIASKLVLRAFADSAGVPFNLSLDLDQREEMEKIVLAYDDQLDAFMAEHLTSVTVLADGSMTGDFANHRALLPGSFNPLHSGHQQLATIASKILNLPVVYELSASNVDKPSLNKAEICNRLMQFYGKGDVVITDAVLFEEKAKLFPGCTFVIGIDTAFRILDTNYYLSGYSGLLKSLDDIKKMACQFLVAGRYNKKSFQTLSDLSIPSGFESLFIPISEDVFRIDISSSDLRIS